ncbi:extracellular solute-binding protein [Terasakiella sp. A23]|uniref:extracellular solute-binding protein n=1 Tax=Terasakiella sp. FCG-A23 TaxID=3080561 RepID=UPI002953CBA6|nr:extracellular solute-binding protein [Terasakiella sp. A23]MDV7341291.1 extracellular solute-binding protein [Terasakiella sp. A23]
MDFSALTFLEDLVDPLINPQKRIFIGYLLSALVVALIFYFISSNSKLSDGIKQIFSKDIWWSKSARSDYLIVVINKVFMMGIAPVLLSKLALATILFESLHTVFDGRPQLLVTASDWMIAFLFTLTLFLFDDFAKYWLHRWLHTVPFLWPFHKVHHTAETLTPFTVLRAHPVEGVLFALRSTIVQAATLGVFFFFFGSRMELMTVFGANIFLFIFNVTGANLRHSHVWISYGRWLEHILISPAQHQIHHSIEQRHYDTNYGAVLAIWDWMGKSLHLAVGEKNIQFGVAGETSACHNLKNIYLTPFSEAVQSISVWRQEKMKNIGSKLRAGMKSLLVAGVVGLPMMASSAEAAELNIYSHRQPFLINPFIKAYEKETGTKVNIVYAAKGLAQRLQAEGKRSPADVILTVDIARLSVYADKDLLAPVKSDVLMKNIPAHMRDKDGKWFAFSKRARVIVAAKVAEDTKEIKTYEDLADPKWKGRICARPGSHVYNRALIASFIEHKGEEAAQKWSQAIVDNLARRPQGNDRAQVKAIFEGVCDLAVINNYYFGKLKHSDKADQREWAESVRLIFPNQEDRGTHVNISGGGIAIHSKNKEEATRFLEFLTSKTAQGLYGAINYEYPVNPAIEASDELKSWGEFKEDDMPIGRISELAPEAQRIIDRVGW